MNHQNIKMLKICHNSGHALGICICGCSLLYRRVLWASKSAVFNSTKSFKICRYKRLCPKDLRVCAPAAAVLTHSLQLDKTHPYLRFHEIFSTNYSAEHRNIYYLFLKCKESNCGFRKILASLWLLSTHYTPKFRKKARKVISRYRISFLSKHLCSISEKNGMIVGVSRDDFQNVSCLHPENSSAAVSFFLNMYRHYYVP